MKEPVHEEFERIYCSEICKNLALLSSPFPESQLFAQTKKAIVKFPCNFITRNFGLDFGYCLVQIPKSHQCLLHVNRPNGKTFILVAAPSHSEELYVITITLLQTQQGDETCEECVEKKMFEAISVTRQINQLKVGEFLKPRDNCISDTHSCTKEELQHELNEHLPEEVKRRGFEDLESLLQWAKQSRFAF